MVPTGTRAQSVDDSTWNRDTRQHTAFPGQQGLRAGGFTKIYPAVPAIRYGLGEANHFQGRTMFILEEPTIVSVKMQGSERARLARIAKRHSLSLSHFIREEMLKIADRVDAEENTEDPNPFAHDEKN